LAAARSSGDAWLHVYDLPEDAVSLGRFLPAPPPAEVPCLARFSGGRVAPLGPGFVGVALALPHRSALVGAVPLALAPEQVLNRCVRGIMAGCRAMGTELFYPGRDLLTVAGRACAVVSFTVEPDGSTLFEAVLALERDFSVLPMLLDRADPAGLVRADMWQAGQVAALAAAFGRMPSIAEVGDRIAVGYAETFDRTAVLAAPPALAVAGVPACSPVAPSLHRRLSVTTMLGALELHAAVDATERYAGVRITGDLIADPAGIAQLEAALVGCPAVPAAVQAAVTSVYGDPTHFILGIGALDTLTDALLRVAAA
jgi:hypothetical protein